MPHRPRMRGSRRVEIIDRDRRGNPAAVRQWTTTDDHFQLSLAESLHILILHSTGMKYAGYAPAQKFASCNRLLDVSFLAHDEIRHRDAGREPCHEIKR